MTKSKVKRKSKKFLLRSLADTKTLAKGISATLRGGEVLALTGPLGSGKTTFVQYLAKTLGVRRRVRSPSFIILQTFTVKSKFKSQNSKVQVKRTKSPPPTLTLCHVDAYRIEDARELNAVGLRDYLGQPHVITVIEWAEKVRFMLPRHTRWINLIISGESSRLIMLGAKPRHGGGKNEATKST